MYALKFIYKNLDHFRKKFILIFFVGIIDGAALFFIPVVLAKFAEGELNIINFKEFFSYVICFYAISLLTQFIIRKYGESLCDQFANYFKLKCFKKLERLPVKIFIEYHSGYILSLINKVAERIIWIIFGIFWNISHSIAYFSLFFFFTAKESLSIAFLNAMILILFSIISVFLSKKIIAISKILNKKDASLMESYVDFMVNILTVKKLGIADFAENKLNIKTKDNYDQIQKRQDFHANRWLILHSLYALAFLSTIGFLLFQIIKGDISIAVLILFVSAYAVIKHSIERLSENFKILMEMKEYVKTLEEIITPIKDINQDGAQIKKWQEIKFKNIFFKYPENDKIISIPNFKIKKGEKICVMGESGEGKTTLLNLIADFLKPQKSERLVDNNSYEKIDKDFFKSKMVMVSQEIELFNLSLKENISLGKNISEEKIIGIFKELNLSRWLKTLPNGLNTKIGEKGIKLSAGQKQRINLIRGILLNREIFLLDEPTSHLDSETKEKVILFLKKYLKGKTAVIVSHHQNLRRICDRCYNMKNGVLKELI
ncbi:ABC transporter ATP-binding protein [Candidatus Parcubacteria bacterium]|nr:ABC transporter ATP-binding protein [Candidatus Parcubacteria bacterium]